MSEFVDHETTQREAWRPFVLGAGYFEQTPAPFAEVPIYAGLVDEWVRWELRGRCGSAHPTNPSMIDCQLRRGHDGDHWSSSGCSGGQFAWDAEGTTYFKDRSQVHV